MKKRILAGLCVLVLCLGALSVSATVRATGTPCFMAVNDNLLPLEDRYIPITINNQYYVPYTALDGNATGVKLGIFPIYNALSNTLIIYNREQVLSFDLATGTCEDRNGNSQSARAVIRNGRVYVPARFICNYFDLVYTARTSTYGPLLRICNSSAILDDNNFVGAAQLQMEDLLREWRKSQDAEEPVVTPTTPPSVTPPVTNPSAVRTYLAFCVEQTDGLSDLLSRLEQQQVQALFFFPATDLAEYDSAVRGVLCGGHAVGLLVSGTDESQLTDQVNKGNRILAQIAYLNTHTVLAADAETELALRAMDTDLLLWSTNVDARPDGHSAFYQTTTVMSAVETYRDTVYLLSDTSTAGSALMRRILSELVQDHYDLRLAVETELQEIEG